MTENPYHPPTSATPYVSQQRDLSAFVARYLFWLGVINLLGLNLVGALWIWFSGKIKDHNRRFRIATLILCGIMAATGIVVIALTFLRETGGTSILFFGNPIANDPPAWIICVLGVVITIVHGIPVAVLLDPATKSRFYTRVE